MKLSKRAQGVSGSLTLAIDSKAKKMQADGLDVVGFGVGEPDFNTPEYIIRAAHEALDKGITKYTAASGTPDLKNAIVKKLERDNGLSYDPSQIVVSNGAKHALYNAFQALLDEGDEVIIPAPYWLSYPEMVMLCGGVPVIVQTDAAAGFRPDPGKIRAAVTEKTQAIVINSPSNPTGCIYSEAELRAFADIAIEHDLVIISDEIYEELVYDGAKHTSIASLGEDIKERTVLINGMSKAYAMTGWRIGYSAANKRLAKAMADMQSNETANPNSVAQAASVVALNGGRDELDRMVAEFSRRRARIIELLEAAPCFKFVKPTGAFYVMIDVSGYYGMKHGDTVIADSMAFTEALLDKKYVALAPGSVFGAPDYIRISYATNIETIEKGVARIEEFISELK